MVMTQGVNCLTLLAGVLPPQSAARHISGHIIQPAASMHICRRQPWLTAYRHGCTACLTLTSLDVYTTSAATSTHSEQQLQHSL
jgi:hypothetical protein